MLYGQIYHSLKLKLFRPGPEWFIFRNLTSEFNDDVISMYFPVKRSCLYNKKVRLAVRSTRNFPNFPETT